MNQAELSDKDVRRFLRFAEETAIGAGNILKKNFASEHRVTYKGRIDPVTEADVKSEKYITARIRAAFSDHAILAEEGTGAGNGDRHRGGAYRVMATALAVRVRHSSC